LARAYTIARTAGTCWLFLGALLLVPVRGSGQAFVRQGDRIRIEVDGTRLVGVLTAFSPDTIQLLLARPDRSLAVRMERVGRLERSRGRQRHFVQNSLIVLAVSAGLMAFLSAAILDDSAEKGALAGLYYGWPLAAVAGQRVRTESWEPARLPGDDQSSLLGHAFTRGGRRISVSLLGQF
jgi:hypothetical protein